MENPRPGLILTRKFGCDTTLGLHSYQICCISYILVCILSGSFQYLHSWCFQFWALLVCIINFDLFAGYINYFLSFFSVHQI